MLIDISGVNCSDSSLICCSAWNLFSSLILLIGFGSFFPAHGALCFLYAFPNSKTLLGMLMVWGFCVGCRLFLVMSRYGEDLG